MNEDELWAAIDAQRVRTVRLLQDLTPADWELASLCDGWRVRDVAAHLTMQQMTLGDALKALFRHPGGMNHVNHANAVSAANRPTEELIAEIGGMIGSRRHNVGVTPRDTLIDISSSTARTSPSRSDGGWTSQPRPRPSPRHRCGRARTAGRDDSCLGCSARCPTVRTN
jgi:uncharacterized protein (TIGR03083 family)